MVFGVGVLELNIMEKITYNRAILLSLQFISASMNKPEGLPVITDVILDRVNKMPLQGKLKPRPLPSGAMDRGGSGFRPSIGLGEAGWRDGPRRHFSLSVDVQLNKAKEAWKAPGKKQCEEVKTTEEAMTQDLLNRLRGILNKLTPQKFQQLTKQVKELPINTEGRLKGVISVIYEKAIAEPSFSAVYANMCHCLMELEVPSADKPGVCVTFRRLLLNRCKMEFDRNLNAAQEEEKQLCKEERDHCKNKARRSSLGNLKFIGELYKLKMLTAATLDKCIISKLLIKHDEESMECLCTLVSTIGKYMDIQMAKLCMDQMEKNIKERKTSPRIRFMLQDVVDLRQNNWLPRRADQGPKTIDQIHKDAEMEVQREQLKIQQTLLSKESSRGSGDRLGVGRPGGRGSYTPRQGSVAQDSRVHARSTTESIKQDAAPNHPQPQTPTLTEEEVDKKSTAIVEEYLHINDMEEALRCVQELNSRQLLFVFVRNGLESTLDRSAIARDHMGQLLYQLIKAGILPIQQYYKGLQAIVDVAEDMSTDIPQFWQYLAELIIPMGQLFKGSSKTLSGLKAVEYVFNNLKL